MKIKKFKINKTNAKRIAKQSKNPNVILFLFISAPWCGHCQQMKPEYNKMLKNARNIKNNRSNMMIGNIEDNMLNDFDLDTNISGFPTFRMYGGGKKIKDYNGPRDSINLLNFIKKNSKHMGRKTIKRRKTVKRRIKKIKKNKKTRKIKKKHIKKTLKEKLYNLISSKY